MAPDQGKSTVLDQVASKVGRQAYWQLTYANFVLAAYRATNPNDFQVKNAKAQLETRGEDVDKETAEGDDPAPTSFGVVVLTECRRFTMNPQG